MSPSDMYQNLRELPMNSKRRTVSELLSPAPATPGNGAGRSLIIGECIEEIDSA
jgi:hypothetical protein